MALPQNLAQARDTVRRLIQTVPAVDVGGPVGQPSVSCPDPNNQLINYAINSGISSINRVVSTAQLLRYKIPVQLADINSRGVQYVDYTSEILPPNSLVSTMVANLSFSDGITTERLEPQDFYSQSRDYVPFQQYPPARPMQFIVVGGQLGILPPSATAGTLYMDATVGIPPLIADTDTVLFLPVDYQECIWYMACSLLSGRQATDVEAMQRGQYYDTIGKQGIIQIVQWMSGYDDTMIANIQDTLSMVPLSEMRRRAAVLGPQNNQSPAGEG